MATTDEQGAATARFTREDYARLPEGFAAYLLDGAFVREPAPSWRHQAVVLEVARRCAEAAPRRVLVAPADVVVDRWNVLQPDVLVMGEDVASVAEAEPGTVPVLVVEVLSAATQVRDRTVKTRHYLRAGVAEVWLIDPSARTTEVVTATGARVVPADAVARSAAVPGLSLEWHAIEAAL